MTETIHKLQESRNKKQTEIETLTKQKEELVKNIEKLKEAFETKEGKLLHWRNKSRQREKKITMLQKKEIH